MSLPTASLEDLPAPFPLYILKLLPDLKALDALTRTSLVYKNVFATHAVEVFEHVMMQSVLDRIACEIRAYIILQLEGQGANGHDLNRESLYARSREPVDTTTPPGVLFRALQKFTRLATLGDAILYSKLEHLQRLPHKHRSDTTVEYRSGTAQSVTGRPYDVSRPLSPPRFLEQQRMLRGAWRLEVYESLYSTLPPLEAILDGQLPDADDDEMFEVMSSTLPDTNGQVPTFCDGRVSWESISPMSPAKSDATPTTLGWQETLEDTQRRIRSRYTNGGSFFRSTFSRQYFPLKQADWQVLRSLGLGIWDNRRMAEELELLSVPERARAQSPGNLTESQAGSVMTYDEMAFTWDALYHAEHFLTDE